MKLTAFCQGYFLLRGGWVGRVLEFGQTKHRPTPRHATASSLFCRDVCICLLSRARIATYLPVSSAPSMNWMVDRFLT